MGKIKEVSNSKVDLSKIRILDTNYILNSLQNTQQWEDPIFSEAINSLSQRTVQSKKHLELYSTILSSAETYQHQQGRDWVKTMLRRFTNHEHVVSSIRYGVENNLEYFNKTDNLDFRLSS